MSAEADAFIGIPGGFGTLEEARLPSISWGQQHPVKSLVWVWERLSGGTLCMLRLENA